MPQNKNLNQAWRTDLGEDWKRVHGEYLHTLGNLTLTGYNSEYSDRAFLEKRNMEGGFKESPLKLNEGLGTCESWNEETIKERAERLAKRAVKIWQSPILGADILDAYREKKSETATEYSISDHPHLSGGLPRELFDGLRSEILSLDDCIREEFLKLYVAYKAETNFVDVVPQARRLRLSLNMDFPEIDDPRGICRDVTGVGRWGNGNIEVSLERIEDLPYIIGLIRQSLEKQLGEEDE